MEKNYPYAKLFRALRQECGLGQVEMAKRLGCSQSAVSKIERGKAVPLVGVFLRAYQMTRGRPKIAMVFERFMVSGNH